MVLPRSFEEKISPINEMGNAKKISPSPNINLKHSICLFMEGINSFQWLKLIHLSNSAKSIAQTFLHGNLAQAMLGSALARIRLS
jgi:hypothetical protein